MKREHLELLKEARYGCKAVLRGTDVATAHNIVGDIFGNLNVVINAQDDECDDDCEQCGSTPDLCMCQEETDVECGDCGATSYDRRGISCPACHRGTMKTLEENAAEIQAYQEARRGGK